ncbi:MAG: glycosyltransferase family 87 protein [Parvularculaceae bacterium]
MLDQLKSGDFLTRERMRRIAMVLGVVYLIVLAALFATSDGMRDYNGRPLGTDFSNVYAAGQMARDGDGVRAFDPHYHLARQAEIFNDPDIPVYGWHYPPFFLLVAAALALLPYTAAYLFWQAATLPLYLRAVSAIAPGRTSLVAALVLPATFVNFTHGQNGFLTAALIGAAMALLDRRPLVAGVLIGLLAYKPQFGVLIPLVLIATGRWRVIGAAAATIAGLVAASTLAFGPGVWPAFIDNMRFTNTAIVDGGGRAGKGAKPLRRASPSRRAGRYRHGGAGRAGAGARRQRCAAVAFARRSGRQGRGIDRRVLAGDALCPRL